MTLAELARSVAGGSSSVTDQPLPCAGATSSSRQIRSLVPGADPSWRMLLISLRDGRLGLLPPPLPAPTIPLAPSGPS